MGLRPQPGFFTLGSGGRWRCGGHANRVAGHERFWRIIDDPIGRRQAGNDFHTVTEVAAQLHLLENHLFTVEGRDLRSPIAGHERSRRDCYYIRVSRNFEVHIAVTAAEKLAGCVVGLKLDLHAV